MSDCLELWTHRKIPRFKEKDIDEFAMFCVVQKEMS